tara:strand:+ start:3464 stop:3835 length:372 start_codon:yes stop_codon:yes gene_type:complete
MIVKHYKDSLVVECPKGQFTSHRFLTKQDDVGFSFTRTIINTGGPYQWHYQKHKESCYCESGKGLVKNLVTREEYRIYPGVMYCLDKNEPHEFTAFEETSLLCVFTPALLGNEVHDSEGSYNA